MFDPELPFHICMKKWKIYKKTTTLLRDNPFSYEAGKQSGIAMERRYAEWKKVTKAKWDGSCAKKATYRQLMDLFKEFRPQQIFLFLMIRMNVTFGFMILGVSAVYFFHDLCEWKDENSIPRTAERRCRINAKPKREVGRI